MWALTGVLLASLLVAGCAQPREIQPSRSPSASSTAPGSTPGGAIGRLLGEVRVVPEPEFRPGYDRSCAAGRACVFGEEWTDDHPGRFGRNGCDTRQDVLLHQMRDIEMRWGSTCRIFEARLTDPYTGERLTWRDDGYFIQIDHVYPLARAWHAGAWRWPATRRLRFANDVERELLAVSARANQDKGAQSLADWLPANPAFRCGYVRKYLAVAIAYDLPITRADAEAARGIAVDC